MPQAPSIRARISTQSSAGSPLPSASSGAPGVDRATAAAKVRKLEALAGDVAATPSEASTARRMAQRLRDRHQIRDAPRSPPRRETHSAPPPPAPTGGISLFGSRAAFIKAFDEAMADFNPNTGQAKSDRVHVVRWTDRGNWRIELDI